jgi:hypothetical protein
MARRARYVAITVLALGAAAPALAQYTYSVYPAPGERPLRWQLYTGGAFTTGSTSNSFQDGWLFGGGLTWYPDLSVPLGLRTDINYAQFNATNQLLSLTQSYDGHQHVWSWDFDLEFDLHLTPHTRAYLLAGVGPATRTIDLHYGYGPTYCNPYYGYCYGYGYGQSTSDTYFAWNAGAGLEWDIWGGSSLFIDARYMSFGPSGTTTEFVPLRIGLRF